jgi:hypothetical protein
VQAQDARVLFYKTTPSNALSDAFDPRRAWLAVDKREGPGVYVQLGRQGMVIGSGRLLRRRRCGRAIRRGTSI